MSLGTRLHASQCLSNVRRVQSCEGDEGEEGEEEEEEGEEEEEEVVQETGFLDRHNLTIKGYFS